MEKHTCKLCFRRFSNGRALGGHMRSHVAAGQALASASGSASGSASASATLLQQQSSSVSLPSASCSSSGDDGGSAGGRGKVAAAGVGGFYALRENPRKSFKFADPEFAGVDYAACYMFSTSGNNNNNSASVVDQDRESETESSVRPPCSSSCSARRRSRRLRRRCTAGGVEVEQVSSVSDTSVDENVARCLVMLSRDSWSKTIDTSKLQEGEEELVASSEEEEKVGRGSKKIGCRGGGGDGGGGGRARFQCGACKKAFKSYQALGGHRASHKKIKICIAIGPAETENDDHNDDYDDDEDGGSQIRRDEEQRNGGGHGRAAADPRTHECPFCFRVFTSGQALGGHKRSHLASRSYPLPPAPAPPPPPPTSSSGKVHPDGARKDGDSLIDLNLPAPVVDDEVEFSDVSHTTP